MTLRYVETYLVSGAAPRHWQGRYAVSDPPTFGQTRVIVVVGDKRSTLFHPPTLWSQQVPNNCEELKRARDVELDADALADRIQRMWEKYQSLSLQADYDVAAMVLTEMGKEVPKNIPKAGGDGEVRTKGGKPLEPERFRPVKRGSVRGRVVEFFLSGEPESMREAMAKLDQTRSGVLSHLFTLHKDHGLGYEIVGDCARLMVPEGVDVFAEEAPAKEGEAPRPPSARGPKGKPLDEARLRPIKRKSKRGDVAERFGSGFRSIDEFAAEAGLTRSGVLSHLFTINADHGIGYEVSADGSEARLVYPEGFQLFTEGK